MRKETIKLNSSISIDLEKLIESRLLIQANSGGGKSWAIRRIIEQAFGKVQIIVIDPEGEFGNMRGEFDFVYAGKDGDAPVESRSAALLARRLLELKASTVIDLYELQPQERKHFVRLFCDAMVNAPKELWHDVLVIIDEAHVFAPEKGESEAMGSVIDLATRGRKRGYCVVLATQRLPKLNKDAAAECNNKLIGRASQDIDRKRAADELGFTTKEQILSLRDLDPGEFYTFGPAISRDVIKTTIGEVKVKPAKRGIAKNTLPAPSEKVKSILAKLADLPAEAKQEITTIAELKKENAELKREAKQKLPDYEGVKKIGVDYMQKLNKANHEFEDRLRSRDKEWAKFFKEFLPNLQKIAKQITDLKVSVPQVWKLPTNEAIEIFKKDNTIITINKTDKQIFRGMPVFVDRSKKNGEWEIKSIGYNKARKEFGSYPLPRDIKSTPEFKARVNGDFDQIKELGTGEKLVLKAVAGDPDGITTEHIAVLTGYKETSRRTYLQRLQAKHLVELNAGLYFATPEGIEALGSDFEPLPKGDELRVHVMETLPEGERKVLSILLNAHPETVGFMEIENQTGYKETSRRTYLQRLGARKLVVVENGSARASDKLFD